MVTCTRRNNADGPGFTLLELLLTVTLLLALFAAVVYNFQSAQRGADLEEGARQLEALIRFAGAQAASSGKAVQFRFGDNANASSSSGGTNSLSEQPMSSTNSVNDFASIDDLADWGTKLRVVYEADPVLQPGIFVDLPEANPFLEAIADRVRIEKVRMPERPLNQGTNELAATQQTQAPAAVTFYPDGSSDAVDLVLVSKEREDYRQLTVHLDGVTGGIRKEIKSGDDLVPIEWMGDENSSERKQASSSNPTATTESAAQTSTSASAKPTSMPEDPAFEQNDSPKTENTKTNAFDDFP
jgi:Tfp pilus assembly protein FimT